MKSFKIGSVEIGIGKPPIVIPEIGINHGGSLEVAKKMVDTAAEAGAIIVKHQTHIVGDEMSSAAKNVIPGNSTKSIYDVMMECALNVNDERELMRYAESRGLVFLSTPFSRAAADRLEKFGVLAYKIGSGEMNNFPLIEHIAGFGKPMLVSTGMNALIDIDKVVEILERKSVPYALLHTTNLYPTKPEQVRLGAMMQMIERYPNIPVGLSDHTLNNNACIAAAAIGACLLERHYTDDKFRIGNDIICSMDGAELKELIQASREVFAMRGGEKRALPDEQVTMNFAFATVVAITDIKAGDKLTKDNIWVKRPGIGEILAEFYEDVLGKTAVSDIARDVHLKRDMYE
jgi:sialic acid synthase SpsE